MTALTGPVAPTAYVLDDGEGEAPWFAGGLLTYKATGTETDGHLAIAEMRGPRGSGSPAHRHTHEDEAWYVIDGEVRFWLGAEERTVRAGAFVFGPRGVDHRFEITSEEAHFLLLLLTPAGFGDFTRACGTPATTLTMPPTELAGFDSDVLVSALVPTGPSSSVLERRHRRRAALPDGDVWVLARVLRRSARGRRARVAPPATQRRRRRRRGCRR